MRFSARLLHHTNLQITTLRRVLITHLVKLLCLGLCVAITFSLLSRMSLGANQASTTSPRLDLIVLKGNPTLVTLRAEKAKLSDVAAQLAQNLKVPVLVSPKLKLATVTVTHSKMPLETLVHELAPQVYLDYVLVGGRDAYPICRAIYLHSSDEAAPANTASVQPRSEAYLFEGDTEDIAMSNRDSTTEPPLQVSLLHGRLNVRARQQPLTVVLAEIARQCQVPFEMRHEVRGHVDLNFQGVPLINFPQAFPPEVQFYYRLNLRTLAAQPLHLLLAKPDPNQKES